MITPKDFQFTITNEGDTAIVVGSLCLTDALTFNLLTVNAGADSREAERRTTAAANAARMKIFAALWTQTYGEIAVQVEGILVAAREGGDLRTIGMLTDLKALLERRTPVPTPAPQPEQPVLKIEG